MLIHLPILIFNELIKRHVNVFSFVLRAKKSESKMASIFLKFDSPIFYLRVYYFSSRLFQPHNVFNLNRITYLKKKKKLIALFIKTKKKKKKTFSFFCYRNEYWYCCTLQKRFSFSHSSLLPCCNVSRREVTIL